MQTNKNIPEPTATATPEYCGLTEFEATWLKIGGVFLKFKTQVQIFAEVTDADVLGVYAEELIKLQKELDAIEVPACMKYLKNVLSYAISNSMFALAYRKAGFFSLGITSREMAMTCIDSFTEEYEQQWNVFTKTYHIGGRRNEMKELYLNGASNNEEEMVITIRPNTGINKLPEGTVEQDAAALVEAMYACLPYGTLNEVDKLLHKRNEGKEKAMEDALKIMMDMKRRGLLDMAGLQKALREAK
jgi:hypothetical protein